MADKTARDVIALALRKLNVIGAGEEAEGDIYEDALSEYKTLHEELRQDARRKWRARISWNHDSVPESVFANVAAILQGRLVETISVSSEMRARAKAAETRGKNSLYSYVARPIQRHDRMPTMPVSRGWW